MTKQAEELIAKLRAIGKQPMSVEPATVKSVDETALSCVVELSDETEIPDVRLKAAIDNVTDGLVQIPEVGSTVLVATIGNNIGNRFILAYSAVSETKFNDGANGGLIKIEDLVTKLNNVEGKVNDVIATLKTVVIPLAPSGTYPLATDFGDMVPLTETQRNQLEDDKVKH